MAAAFVFSAAGQAHGGLVNLYTFNDGTADDAVGGANGTLVNGGTFTTTGTSGRLDFNANTGQGGQAGGAYLDLPNGLITGAVNSTAGGGVAGTFSFSLWFTVGQNRGWAAAASFGTSNSGENNTGGGASLSPYLQLIPSAGTTSNPFRLTTHANGTNHEQSRDTTTAPVGTPCHVVAVYDQSAGQPGTFRFYVNGTLIGSNPIAGAGHSLNLASFPDNNNWLGRSQWNDPAFDGSYDELAIYNHPLSQSEVTALYQSGPVPIPAAVPVPPHAPNRPNQYASYPQVSNITSGMSWPLGQALPTFSTPAATLDTILVQDLSPDEEITFSALQGLINKSQPRIYLLDSGADEGTYTWANTSTVNFTSRTLYSNANRFNLIGKYASQLAGVVLYNPATSTHYRNLASSVAGLRNAIPVTPTIQAALTAQGINLPVVVDLTTLAFTTPNDIYNHLFTTYWGECNKRVIVSANPDDGGDLHHTRDIAAATGGAVVWLSTTTSSQRTIFQNFLTGMTAGDAVVLGWYTTERSGVTIATSYGIGTIPADFYISGTVYGGTDHRIRVPKVPPKPPLSNKAYIAIFLSDGDNAQYVQRAMRKFWDQNTASRGIVPLNWTIAPGMVDLGPGLLNYYYTTATPKDCFVCGPSGMGYTMPVNTLNETGASTGTKLTDEAAMDKYARLTETYLHRAGLRVLTVWDNATAMHRESYEQNVRNLYGATVHSFSGITVTPSIENNRLRFDRLLQPYTDNYTAIRDTLNSQINSWNGTSPLFLSTQVTIWGEMKPNRIVDLCNELNAQHPGKLEFVRADHYFNLFNEANNLPFNLSMSPQTSVTSSGGGGNPALATDGSAYSVWTSGSSGQRSLTFDFGGLYNLHRYVIRHAGDTGLSRSLNTRDYRVKVSADGNFWSTIDTCGGNEANVTDVEFPLVTARYLRIIVDYPGASSIARIADVEIFGRNPTTIIPPVPDPSYAAWMESLPPGEKPPEDRRGHLDEPAGDGMSNLLKYALGLKPLVPSRGEAPKLAAIAGETLAIEVTRAKTSTAVIEPEGSTDLDDWDPVDFSVVWQADVGEDRERVRYLIPKPEGSGYFLRLKVELDEPE